MQTVTFLTAQAPWVLNKKSAQMDRKSDLAGQLAQFTNGFYARFVAVREKIKISLDKFAFMI